MPEVGWAGVLSSVEKAGTICEGELLGALVHMSTEMHRGLQGRTDVIYGTYIPGLDL